MDQLNLLFLFLLLDRHSSHNNKEVVDLAREVMDLVDEVMVRVNQVEGGPEFMPLHNKMLK